MSRSILYILFLFITVSHHNLAAQSTGEDSVVIGPRLAFVEDDFDFGQVKMGTVVRHTFIYSNTGDADLIVYDGKGGCSCVKVEFEADTLAPGDSSSITMVFDTKNRVGKEKNSIFVKANTPQTVYRARFKGEILWPQNLTPFKEQEPKGDK